jgi:leucyl-tRNA synthetase
VDEPFKKLINQGMILGESAFVNRITAGYNKGDTYYVFQSSVPILISDSFIDKSLKHIHNIDKDSNSKTYNIILQKFIELNPDFKNQEIEFSYTPFHVDLALINETKNELDIETFKNWREEYKNAEFITEEDGSFKVSREVEKMSKSKYNVVNPDDICEQYGADTLRMYEMFLGPLEQAKPWNTAGITGVHGFLKKLWKLYHSGPDESFYVTDTPPSEGQGEALKTLHKTIKKVQEDIENFSFNTSVSSFMIAVNELISQNCNSREVLEPLAILISPYAPHIAEELWEKLGHSESISTAPFPKFEEKYLVESTKEYPISFNGKMRFTLELPLDISKEEIESAVMAHEKTAQYLEGRTPKKVIIVPGKIVNIVG